MELCFVETVCNMPSFNDWLPVRPTRTSEDAAAKAIAVNESIVAFVKRARPATSHATVP